MGRFLKRLALFAFIFCIIITAFIFIGFCFAPQYTHNYQASVLDKMERLEGIKSSKIILVGNSNAAFGFLSERIEAAFGMPVVNLGLHGGMNNRFHEDMAKYNIGKGDIVVVCHTTYSDNGKIIDCALAWITIENYFHLWPLVRHDAAGMMKAFLSYTESVHYRRITKGDKYINGTCYTREAFNKYGDNIFPRSHCEYTFKSGDVTVFEINSTCIDRLNALNRYCASRGAKLVVAGYPVAEGEYTPSAVQFKSAWDELKSRLDCPVISNIEDYFFPYSDFYDTPFHLTDSGALKRTEQLIADLQRSGTIEAVGGSSNQ